MLNPFEEIAKFFKMIAHAIAQAFVALFGSQASHEFAVAAEKILQSDFGKVILSIVSGLQTFAQSNGGSAARAKAFDEILSQAKAAGLDLKESLINLLIELAVQKLKGTLGALAAGQ